MKKSIAAITAVVVLGVTGMAFANMKDKEMMEGKGGMMGMMDKGMMMKGMMNKTSMVAANDGGVIILNGQKLSKYDANLNLVKEVEIKSEAMTDGKMCSMCQMKSDKGTGKMCAMCQMNKDKETGKADADNKGSQAAKPAVDHAAHH